MRAVNLLPGDASQRKSFTKEDPAVVVGSALGVVVLLALVAGFMNVHGKVNADQKKLDAVRSDLAQLSLIKRKPVVLPKPPANARPIIPVPAVTRFPVSVSPSAVRTAVPAPVLPEPVPALSARTRTPEAASTLAPPLSVMTAFVFVT